MRFSHKLQYHALVSCAWIVRRLPANAALGLGAAVGNLAWGIGIRRKLALSNIAMARPEASPAELARIGRTAVRNFGRTAVEFIRFGNHNRESIRDLVEVIGAERIQKTLTQGKGAIILTGHQGAWALYFAALAESGLPISLLVGRQHNPKVDEFIHQISSDKVELIPKGRSAIKKILAKLSENRAVVIVADQHAGAGGVMVPLLGKATPTLALPGSIATKYGSPVFIMEGHRESAGNHLVKLYELEFDGSGTPEERKIEILKRYNEEMGRIIRERPEQYFWYHRRWRAEDQTT